MRAFRALFMEARPDWNRRGPRLPAWFRPRLQRIDPYLEPQFIPPATVHPDGTDPGQYPQGVWTICRRLPRVGLLHKRWIWSLTDAKGKYRPPGRDTITLVSRAHRLFRARRLDVLEDECDAHFAALKTAKVAESKTRHANRIAATMRKLGYTNFAGRRISTHGLAVPGPAV